MESPNTLMMTHIITFLQITKYCAYMCSAGTRGYHALKEVLQNGKAGSLLLIESSDIRRPSATTTSENDEEENDEDGDAFRPFLYVFDTVDNEGADRDYMHASDLKVLKYMHIYCNMEPFRPSILYFCKGLRKAVLQHPMPQIADLNDLFAGCHYLEEVDLSPFSHMTTVGGHILSSCISLKAIDLSPLSKVTEIGPSFLFECRSLLEVDLSPLANLINIGNSFLSSCSGLTTVELSPLTSVTTIGRYFLRGCIGLSIVDLSTLSVLICIPPEGLTLCGGSIILPPHLLLGRKGVGEAST